MPNILTSDFWQTITPARVIGKIRNYITLPAFEVDFDWQQVATVVAEYQYETTKNFTLVNVPDAPDGVNFTLCIKYRFDDGEVVRYSLWLADVEGASLPNVPAYDGQVIKKHFTLEIWSSTEDETPVVLEDDTVFNLSILSRRTSLADDDTVENCDPSDIVTELGNTNEASGSSVTIEQAFPTAVDGAVAEQFRLFGFYDGSNLAAGLLGTWTPVRSWLDNFNLLEEAVYKPTVVEDEWTISSKNYVNFDGTKVSSYSDLTRYIIEDESTAALYELRDGETNKIVTILDGTQVASNNKYVSYGIMLLRQNTWNATAEIFNTYQNGESLTQTSVTPNLKLDNAPENSRAVLGRWVIAEFWFEFTAGEYLWHLKITDLKLGTTTETTAVASQPPTAFDYFNIGDGLADFDLAAFGFYFNTAGQQIEYPAANRLLARQYLMYQYGGPMGLPLVYTEEQHGVAN